jgi:WD40 repeat protein
MAISPQGTYCAVGNNQGKLFIFDLIEGKIKDVIDSETISGITSTCWDPTHGHRIASIDTLGCLFIWE